MKRREFIEKLRSELSRLPQEEIEAAVEYYEEYFDDAGRENEKEVLQQLGSPKKVAAQIKSEYAMKLFDEDKKPTVKKGISAVWYVILGICSAPVSIPLAIALGALAIAILIALAGCVISLFAGIAGCVLGAVAFIIIGFMAVPVSVSTAMIFVGIGAGALGFMAAMGALLFLAVRAGVNALVKAARKRNERKRIRKMLDKSEQKKWRYQGEDTAGDLDEDQKPHSAESAASEASAASEESAEAAAEVLTEDGPEANSDQEAADSKSADRNDEDQEAAEKEGEKDE